MQRVVFDANVFLSTLVHRNDEHRAAAKALLLKAEGGELQVILPNRYDAIATFDQKLSKRAKDLGVATYW